MKITIINKGNEEYFLPFMTNVILKESEDLLCLGALDEDGNVTGALAAQLSENGAEIMSIYVVGDSRRMGYGRALVSTLFSLVEGTGQNRVSVHFPKDKATLAFYDSMGFELMKDVALKYVRVGDALESSACQKNVLPARTDGLKLISELSPDEMVSFARYMKKKGFLISEYYDPAYSSVCINAEGKVTSVLLANAGTGAVAILWMDFIPACQKELFGHLGKLLRSMQKDRRFDLDSKIYFEAVNEKFVDVLTRVSLGRGYVKKEDNYVFGAKVV